MSGIGRRNTTKSVVMLIPAAMYQTVKLSKQLCAIEGYRTLIGVQANATRKDWMIFQVTAKPMMQYAARCSHTARKMRWYWSRRLTLTKQSAQMYSSIAEKRHWSCRIESSGPVTHECLPTP